MASPSELSLDCKPYSHSMLLKSFSHDQQTHDPTRKLEDFLSRLEEERLKIDAFKRELPLCMQLLTNALETSRQQLQAYRANDQQGHQRPVLEEFIPLKQYSNNYEENQDKAATNISDKANWMTTAQLWCQTTSNNINEGSHKQQSTITSTTQETDNNIMGFNIVSPKLNLDAKQRNGGAFLPFSKDGPSRGGVTELALIASNEIEMEDKKCFQGDNNGGVVVNDSAGKQQIHATSEAQGATTNTTTSTSANGNNGNQTHRKARRCWSPDLHRRFVNALQMLGGSQVATPKQIRELMKVDGLTNDEVKSHLQKYRLHTRRPSCPSPQAAGTPPPQLVVLGGIWVPPEYAAAAAAAHSGGPTMTTLYSAAHQASHASPHYCQPPVPSHHLPQDHHFYTTTNPTNNNSNALPPPTHHHRPHHHGQLLHHQLHVYNSSPQTHSLPESDGRGDGDRSESIEDGKSESSSWKGDSGENGGERKLLVALRDDGEESNGSEITLKF